VVGKHSASSLDWSWGSYEKWYNKSQLFYAVLDTHDMFNMLSDNCCRVKPWVCHPFNSLWSSFAVHTPSYADSNCSTETPPNANPTRYILYTLTKLVDQHVHRLHVVGVERPLGLELVGHVLHCGIEGGLEIAHRGRKGEYGLLADLVLAIRGCHANEFGDGADYKKLGLVSDDVHGVQVRRASYSFLSPHVVLHSGSTAPCSVESQFRLFILQLLDKGHP